MGALLCILAMQSLPATPCSCWHCCHALSACTTAALWVLALQIEQAYDILLMQAMKRRLTGEGVGANVRFADVAPKRSPGQASMVT